jgi:hypothetical protein
MAARKRAPWATFCAGEDRHGRPESTPNAGSGVLGRRMRLVVRCTAARAAGLGLPTAVLGVFRVAISGPAPAHVRVVRAK